MKSSNVAPVICTPLPDLAVKSAKNSMNYYASFILRREKAKENLIPLYLRITYRQKRVEVSLNHYIHPDQWVGQRLSLEKKFMSKKDIKAINEAIENCTHDLRSIFNELKAQNAPITANLLKDKLLGKEKPQITEKKKTILDACNHYIKDLEVQSKYGDCAEATVKKYQYLATHLSNFMYYKCQQTDLTIEQLDLYFVKQFFSYLLEEIKFKNGAGKLIIKKRNRNNSAIKCLKNFKTVINNVAIAFGWISKNPFAGFKMKMEKVEKVHLTEHEINAILNKDIENERLAVIKNLFLFQCFTGLAYIDMERLTKNNIVLDIEGNKWLSVARKKTNTPCKIPLLSLPENIINKYANHPVCINSGKLLPVISNQNYNQYLKELATICNINKSITTHVGRRSFASLALNNGVPAETLIKIIGHTNFSTLHLYAKHDEKKINSDIQQLKKKFA